MEQQKRDVVEYCRKLRVSQRPPYHCPNANCLKVYRSICGLQSHLLTVDHTGSSTPASGRRKVSSQLHSPATAQLLDTPAVTSLTYAEAQNTVQFELDGRLTRVNIHDRLELHCIDAQAEPRPGTELQVAELQDNKSVFPEPLFRILDSYVLKDAPPMPSSYIRFVECPAEELDARVEYELDEQDCAWLQLMNELRASKGLPKVREDVLELLMDRLEKECYFQVQRRNKASDADDAPLGDDDAVCCICMVGECHASNAILFCDMCNLAVHQDCYGVPYIPEGQWLCRRCLQSPSRAVSCLLCPNKGGAFKQTDRGCWVHVVCAMWIPEVRFANPVFLEPVDSIELIPAARWKLTCYLCRKRGVGTCVQCHKTNCYVPFHVTCAQHAGLYMRLSKSCTGSTMDPGPVCVQRTVYCGTHSPGATPSELSQQAARRPASTWLSTSVSIPTIPLDRIQEIASLVDVEKKSQFVLRVIAYWSLKRQLYNGVPLLRRLQVSSSTHAPNKQPAITADGGADHKGVVQVTRVRQHMERARLLCELLRKRERLKAKMFRMKERCLELELQALVCFLRRLWELIQARDINNIFSEPVDTSKVAGYAEIVARPMDLSTMRSKIDNWEYPSLDAFEQDFDLMIDNCLAFNARDTIYYKAGVRMRSKCGAILSQARSDLASSCIDPDTGVLLSLTTKQQCPPSAEEIAKQVEALVERCKVQPSAEDVSQLQCLLGGAEDLARGPGRSKLIRSIKSHLKIARRKLTLGAGPGVLSRRKARAGARGCYKTAASSP
ncbi:peregrin-like isoform X2 [Bacillus rossius redtenbacheri]